MRLIHSNFQTNGATRVLLSVQFAMLQTREMETIHAAHAGYHVLLN